MSKDSDQQLALFERSARSLEPGHSRYFRTTASLVSETQLTLPSVGGKIYHLSTADANGLIDAARRSNVFMRHSRERSFYAGRLLALGNRTVVEVVLPGSPRHTFEKAERIADVIETTAQLCCIFASSRKSYHACVGVGHRPKEDVAVSIGPTFYYLRARTKRASRHRGLRIAARFVRRFDDCHFQSLANACCGRSQISRVVSSGLTWLAASRRDMSETSAVVKTAIALEALLLRSPSEPVTQTLAERAAFILGSGPEQKRAIYRAIKHFYGIRSRIVHGHSQSAGQSVRALEGADRLTLLLMLTISANRHIWKTPDGIAAWCEEQRWGSRVRGSMLQVPGSHLSTAIRMALSS